MKCGFRKWEPFYTYDTDSTVQLYQDLGLLSTMHQHSGVSRGMTQLNSRRWIAHLVCSAKCLIKGLFLLGDKDKQSQALPLKEDFRQVPGQVTGQVFQTT